MTLSGLGIGAEDRKPPVAAATETSENRDALALRNDDLARSLTLLRATLESTSDGILVTDVAGKVIDYNQRFAQMWAIPAEILQRENGRSSAVHELAGLQTEDPPAFKRRLAEIFEKAPDDSDDLIELANGRIYERRSRIQRAQGQITGRVWTFRDATARLQSEIVARRLAAIVDSSDDAIVGKDLNFVITSWNAGAERIFGYTAEEMIGSAIFRIVPPDRHDEEEGIRKRIIRGERVPPMETVRVAKGGRLVDISVTISPIKDSSGRVIGASKVARDITEKKRIERERKMGEARNAAILESALDCIVTIDHESAVLEWNPAAERTFGFSREQAVGRCLSELIIPPALREKHLAGMRRFLRERVGPVLNRRIEVPALHADGRELLVELAITPIPVEGPPTFTAYLRDLTEQRRNERALAENNALIRAVVEGTEDAIFVKDAEGRYLLINPSGARQLGRAPGEIVGKRDGDLFPPALAAATMAADHAVMASGQSHTHEETHAIEGAARTLLSTKSPFRDEKGNTIGVIGLSRDITERKLNEKALEAAKIDAETANQAKSEFLSRMSHELRTPLNAVIGFSQLLQEDELSGEQGESVEVILSAGRHLLALINDVLDISRIESDRIDLFLEPISLSEIAEEAIRLVIPSANRLGIRLHNQLDERLQVLADRQRARQILLNLLSNAVKYNRKGGEVTLSARLTNSSDENRQVNLEVSDTGIGISSEAMSKLFTPFDRLGAEKTAIEGVGLGLALTKRLAELMGASITVSSEVGKGSTFSVTFQAGSSNNSLESASRLEPFSIGSAKVDLWTTPRF